VLLILFQVTAVVLVLMLGGATTLRDKWRPTKADTEQADVGAPAVTGAHLSAKALPLANSFTSREPCASKCFQTCSSLWLLSHSRCCSYSLPQVVNVPCDAAGAPAARGVDAPGPIGIEGVEKVGAGIMFL
jgi:hypothetical protein